MRTRQQSYGLQDNSLVAPNAVHQAGSSSGPTSTTQIHHEEFTHFAQAYGIKAHGLQAIIDEGSSRILAACRDSSAEPDETTEAPSGTATNAAATSTHVRNPPATDTYGLDLLCAAAEQLDPDGWAEAGSKLEAQGNTLAEGRDDEALYEDEDADTIVDEDKIEVADEEEGATEDESADDDEDQGQGDERFIFVVGRFIDGPKGTCIDQASRLLISCIDKTGRRRTNRLDRPDWNNPLDIARLNKTKNQWLRRTRGKPQKEVQLWQDDERQHLMKLIRKNKGMTVAKAKDSLNKFNEGKTWVLRGQSVPRKERDVGSVSSEWNRKGGPVLRLRRELGVAGIRNKASKPKSTVKVDEEDDQVVDEEEQETVQEMSSTANAKEDDPSDAIAQQNPTPAPTRSNKRKRSTDEEGEEELATPSNKNDTASKRPIKRKRT
ncbi:hypothetical protein H2201_002181 [Coniosporium apollinis]|uniref:Myb-like domain-containing protein n=2 Tax=Coniosporium TaxID=2810619 RepID=A0ABQ9P0Y7_9PEZI|nr:hypothetical protein H2199_005615 [Cladosporium sp. JES 115]KAJ9667646.1 hypothetical protein H2201_002181 [Coniosporium apollinis]